MTIFILKGNGILGFVREDAFSFFGLTQLSRTIRIIFRHLETPNWAERSRTIIIIQLMSPTGFEPAIARLEVGYLIRFGHEPKRRVAKNRINSQ